jgi:hypothetical protein
LPDRLTDREPPCTAAPVSPARRPEPLAWWLAVGYGALLLFVVSIGGSVFGLW